MKQVKLFSDERLEGMCSYCGSFPDTRDHVPSKVLLNDPFPENLPVVPCCNECNQNFSTDEEYFACILECMINGTADINHLKRDKVKRILTKKPYLQKKMSQAFITNESGTYFTVEPERIENVLLKLAKGHAKFETSQPQFDKPTFLAYKPLHTMTDDEADRFFALPEMEKIPEVGSRIFYQIVLDSNTNTPYSSWIPVQDDIYTYLISSQMSRLSVRIIIHDFLAVEVIWEE